MNTVYEKIMTQRAPKTIRDDFFWLRGNAWCCDPRWTCIYHWEPNQEVLEISDEILVAAFVDIVLTLEKHKHVGLRADQIVEVLVAAQCYLDPDPDTDYGPNDCPTCGQRL